METLLIYLLLLYNAWLVAYILFRRKKNDDVSTEKRPSAECSKEEDGIVGKSRFKMGSRVPISARATPNAATCVEDEDVTDIAATFADENEEIQSARLPDDKLDEAFEDIRISDVGQEYDEDEQERSAAKGYATGASFEEIGTAIRVADNPSATSRERKQAGQVFAEMRDNEFYKKLTENNPEREKKIKGLMDEISNKPISGEGEAVGVSVHPQNKAGVEVPADISGFDIRDFV